MRGRLVRVAVLTAAVGTLAGCYRGPGVTASSATVSPTEGPSSAAIVATPTNCVSLSESIYAADPTLENLRAESRDVVIGSVTGKGAAFWDSPTGNGPKTGEQPGEGREFFILTPYTVTVDAVVAGNRPLGAVTVLVEGGKVGCSTFSVSPGVSLEVNRQYALFLDPRQAANGSGQMDAPAAFQAFPVQADGKVLTPFDGAVSLAALSSALSPDAQSPAP